jgi:hypothetical protein
MLKFFGADRPDHPMADPRDARRILEALPARDDQALEELTHWHESLATAEGFRPERRFQLAAQIDEAAQSRLRKLAREYLAATRPSRFQEAKMWRRLHEYYRQAAEAYAGCLEASFKGADPGKGALPLLLVRALRSLARQVKWLRVRYGPLDPALWGRLNRTYAIAELRGLAEASVAIYPGVPGDSTPRREFLTAAMFSCSSPDCLLPPEVELTERLIAELAPQVALASAPGHGLPYWTDLALAMAPQRATKPPPATPGLRCFGPGAAAGALRVLIERIDATGEVPAGLNLGASHAPATVLEVMQHLAAVWSPELPERKYVRHTVKSRLTVAHGFEGVLDALGGADTLAFDKREEESWVVEDVSAGGFGALVPQLHGEWLRVGTLLAMQPEGGNNWVVGVVRRVNRISDRETRVGIQTLSKTPAVSKFDLRGIGTQYGVVLEGGEQAAIALSAGVYAKGLNLEAERAGRQHVYMPQGVTSRGEDYEIVRFREMVRES